MIVHSTDVYSGLDINHSPLCGVGKTIFLEEFDKTQVQDLLKCYGLQWSSTEVQELMQLVGGHPYLIDLALKSIADNNISIEEFLVRDLQKGLYIEYLAQQLGRILEYSELETALKEVVTASQSVQLKQVQLFKLEGMGLISTEGNYARPRCQLFRQYFSIRLYVEDSLMSKNLIP